VTIIDAHMHLVGDHPDTLAFLERRGVGVLNVCVAESDVAWRQVEAEPYRTLAQRHPERYAWCTSFDLPTFEGDYAERVIAALQSDFAAGAVACKVWKNIGMEVKRPDGEHVLVDDPLFEPIFAYLARAQKPLLMHIAEPLACWRPLTEASPHREYYRQHPEWHMHGRTDVPSHARLIASRDAVVAHHPDLRVIGAHLGSLEFDLAEVAKRLDAHPNFAVDISARLADLMRHDGESVRAFVHAYQDRILFGTDVVMRTPHSSLSDAERARQIGVLEASYRDHARYFETDEEVSHRGSTAPGLHLSDDVLAKLYVGNARAWYPLA
jgi:predicted TIM-barrel fold metal-dependent hydrolase